MSPIYKQWSQDMDNLLEFLVGKDQLEFTYTERSRHCIALNEVDLKIFYDHSLWEEHYSPGNGTVSYVKKLQDMSSTDMDIEAPEENVTKTTEPSGTDDLDSLEEDTEVSVKCPSISDPSPKNSFDVRMQDAENHTSYDKLAKLNRGEAQTIKVPPVKTLLAHTRILPQPGIGSGRVLTNPFNIAFRPPSNCVTEAIKGLKLASGPDSHKIDVENEDSAEDHIIEFPGLGYFSLDAVRILGKFDEIRQIANDVEVETNWLKKAAYLNSSELASIQDVLWKHPYTYEITRHRGVPVTVESFSSLVSERYTDDNLIDYLVLRYMDSLPHTSKATLYIPCGPMQFLKNGDENEFFNILVDICLAETDEDALKQITQVIFAVNFKEEGTEHWGVCRIELSKERVYFDDGLKLPPPKRLPLYVRQVLSTLRRKCPAFQYNGWAIPDFERFDMPRQPNGAREVGAASCGIAVILSIWYFVSSPDNLVLSVGWRFSQMDMWRQRLMVKILNWR